MHISYRAGPLILAIGLVTGLALAAPGRAAGEEPVPAPAPGYAGVGVFEMPRLSRTLALALNRARSGDLAGSGVLLDQMMTRHDQAWALRTARALVAVRAGDMDRAVAAFLEADRLGAPGLRTLLARPELAVLATDPRLADITERPVPDLPPAPVPVLAKGNEARIGPANTGWDSEAGTLVARVTFPPIIETHAFLQRPPEGPLAELQRLVARGHAAGNAGDLYDNRDNGHSRLRTGRREQLTRVVYGPEAQAAGVHYGLNTQILFDAPTFGNSSTARTKGPYWRSQPRVALTSPGGPERLWALYGANHIYVYPEHDDHDPDREKRGRGDLFPANTPYMLISQGSSGSDKPILGAIRAILAAFPPDTKARLVEERLITPMVQQVFRRGTVAVAGDREAYMGPLAHPSVFRREDIDLGTMIRLAQDLRPGTIPPMVRLALRREDPPEMVFADRLNARLFETPGAIARLWRGAGGTRTFELEARAEDPNGHAVTFHWRLLRGDADRVRIEPLDAAGTRVRLTLGWHDRAPVPGRPEITSPRVDIAVFADNGHQLSAPAFFSMLYPGHQARRQDAAGRLLSIDHREPGRTYADPLIWPRRDWEDRFLYDDEGRLTGWTRFGKDEAPRSFTAHGLEVLERDLDGRPSLARRVTYPGTRNKRGRLVITESPDTARFRYSYDGPDDRIGRPVPE